MPEIDLEKHGRVLQLGVSTVNMIVLVSGLFWAMAVWYGDTKNDRAEVAALKAEIAVLKGADQKITDMVRDGQDKTSNRLTTLETQNSFILQGLNELKASVATIRRQPL